MQGLRRLIRDLTKARQPTFVSGADGKPSTLAGAILNPPAPTIYTCGNSLDAANLISTPPSYINRAAEGAFNWCDGFLGGAFVFLGNLGGGGKTCRQMIDEQFPVIDALATKPRYIWMTSACLNDVYAETVSVDTAYARQLEAIEWCAVRGITPIWSSLIHKAYDSVATAKSVQLNDRFRQYASANNVGFFIDFALVTADPTDANNQGRLPLSSFFWDSTTHPNNLLSMRMGQYAASILEPRIAKFNSQIVGNEDLTLSGAKSNILVNPSFIGTAGTASTGATGTVPTGFTVDWATRTGTGSAACAIVSVVDPITGLQIANGLQLTLSGAANANDVLRVTQTQVENSGLTSNLPVGSVFSSEGSFFVSSGANISEVAHRSLVATESSWAGTNQQTAAALPATVPACLRRTMPITVLSNSSARYDWRIKFNGAGTGSVITIYKPRLRKVS